MMTRRGTTTEEICEVYRMRKAGMSYQQIEDKLQRGGIDAIYYTIEKYIAGKRGKNKRDAYIRAARLLRKEMKPVQIQPSLLEVEIDPLQKLMNQHKAYMSSVEEYIETTVRSRADKELTLLREQLRIANKTIQELKTKLESQGGFFTNLKSKFS